MVLPDISVTSASISLEFDPEQYDLADFYVLSLEPSIEPKEIMLYTSPMQNGPIYAYTFVDLNPFTDYVVAITPYQSSVNGSMQEIAVQTSKSPLVMPKQLKFLDNHTMTVVMFGTFTALFSYNFP